MAARLPRHDLRPRAGVARSPACASAAEIYKCGRTARANGRRRPRHSVPGVRVGDTLHRRWLVPICFAYPYVVDSGTLQTQYLINGLPVHVFIGRDGVIRKIVAGEMAHAEILAAVRSIL